MSYQEHNGIPPYDFIKLDARGMPMRRGDGLLIWGRKDGLFPPAICARINVRINACGPAVVTGYFSQDGYLGLLCRLENPPAWHRKQNNDDPTGHVFGPEFELLDDGAGWPDPGRAMREA